MICNIRAATQNDMLRVLELINELALFEKEPNAVEISVDDLIENGFGNQPVFKCFVAEIDGVVQGIALVYPRFSTWKGVVVHLEDLIVNQQFRGHGIGTKLLDQVVTYSHKLGVKRVCWDVLDWNEGAIKFYEDKGAKVMRDWDIVQLDEKGIDNYILKLKNANI